MVDLRKVIEKHALYNAVTHKGKANLNAVIRKVVAENPEIRDRIKDVIEIAKEFIQIVNSLSVDEQRKRLEEIAPELLYKKDKKLEEKKLPELPNFNKYKKIVMRLAPYPSGPLHIGNARMVVLNDEYVKMYDGELILAYDDTIGSEKKRIAPEAYDLIKEGLEWLGVKWHKTIYKSDRVPIFYDYCRKLIEMGYAYVCKCSQKDFIEKYKKQKRDCPHRNRPVEENLEDWDRMLEGYYREKEAVVRLKTGMDNPNPALRDVVIMRISEREHPRVGDKYRVWPLLEFNWAIDDHLLGVTHILRGKDLIKEDIIEEFVWNVFGWKKAEFIHYGRIMFKGISLSKSKAQAMIRKGIYRGWNDPRTWSLQSLASRGIEPEALRETLLSFGLSMTDIEFSPEILYSHNRKIIDKKANRYFFINDPILISVKGLPFEEVEVKVPLHPDFKDRGFRKIRVSAYKGETKLYITREDWGLLKEGDLIRLKEFMNIRIKDKGKLLTTYDSKELKEKEIARIIHWVPYEENVDVEVLMPDGKIASGYGEIGISDAKVGDVVQFERFGFVKIHSVEPKVFCYYGHK
ncbi:MAG: glutamate--tRNA ligase [Candidatus Asgardarchaeia archaeon]